MVYPYSVLRLLVIVGLCSLVTAQVSASGSGAGHYHRRHHYGRHHNHLDKLLPRSSDDNCGCDEDGSLQHHHHSNGKLLSPRSLNLQLMKPNNLMIENLANYGFGPLSLAPPPQPPPPPSGHMLVSPSMPPPQPSTQTIVTTSEARPIRQFNYPHKSPRQAKVNEYFYKSDPGHPIMSPYTLKGKDGRLYTNYRPDHQVPDEHLPTAAATNSVPRYVQAPSAPVESTEVLGRRVARSLMPPEILINSALPLPPPPPPHQQHPGMEIDPIKRNDASELMYPSEFGFASPASYPRPGASGSAGVPPQLWNSFSQLTVPQWSSSNLSPVPVRIPGLSNNGLTNGGNPLLAGSSPVNSPGANGVPGSSPTGSPGSPGLPGQHPQMNMHNWFNFLNQPFYGPPMMNPFQTMGANPVDPSQQPQLPQQQQPSTGNTSTEKGEKNSSGEENSNSNDESANKPNNRRQRILNQLNNLSRVPLENLRNFFQRVTSTTTTTESPKDSES